MVGTKVKLIYSGTFMSQDAFNFFVYFFNSSLSYPTSSYYWLISYNNRWNLMLIKKFYSLSYSGQNPQFFNLMEITRIIVNNTISINKESQLLHKFKLKT